MLKLLLKLVILVLAVIGIAAIAIVVLDSTDSDSDDSPVGTITSSGGTGSDAAADVLQQATDATAQVSSFHFVLSHENGSTPLPLNLDLDSAEGDVIVPDRMKADVDAKAAGINVSVQVIGIEDQTWVTNPFTRNWQELPGTNIRDFANPAALVSGLLPSIQNPQMSDGGKVDGVDTDHITGTMDSAALKDALGIAEAGHQVTVEAWIGKDDNLPRRVRLAGALSDAEDSDVVRNVELSRYNQPVDISPPE
jgi:hypothetical protein